MKIVLPELKFFPPMTLFPPMAKPVFSSCSDLGGFATII